MTTIEQLPDSQDISIVAGDTFQLHVFINRNLDGYTLDAHVVNGSTTVPFTITEDDFTFGKFYISLTAVQTAALPKVSPWAIEWIDTGLNHRTIVSGNFKVATNV